MDPTASYNRPPPAPYRDPYAQNSFQPHRAAPNPSNYHPSSIPPSPQPFQQYSPNGLAAAAKSPQQQQQQGGSYDTFLPPPPPSGSRGGGRRQLTPDRSPSGSPRLAPSSQLPSPSPGLGGSGPSTPVTGPYADAYAAAFAHATGGGSSSKGPSQAPSRSGTSPAAGIAGPSPSQTPRHRHRSSLPPGALNVASGRAASPNPYDGIQDGRLSPNPNSSRRPLAAAGLITPPRSGSPNPGVFHAYSTTDERGAGAFGYDPFSEVRANNDGGNNPDLVRAFSSSPPPMGSSTAVQASPRLGAQGGGGGAAVVGSFRPPSFHGHSMSLPHNGHNPGFGLGSPTPSNTTWGGGTDSGFGGEGGQKTGRKKLTKQPPPGYQSPRLAPNGGGGGRNGGGGMEMLSPNAAATGHPNHPQTFIPPYQDFSNPIPSPSISVNQSFNSPSRAGSVASGVALGSPGMMGKRNNNGGGGGGYPPSPKLEEGATLGSGLALNTNINNGEPNSRSSSPGPPTPTEKMFFSPNDKVNPKLLTKEQRKVYKTFCNKQIDKEGPELSFFRQLKEFEWGKVQWKKLIRMQFRWKYLRWWIAAIIAGVVTFLIAHYDHEIVSGLKPTGEKLRDIPAGWTIPIAILFVLSFPPLFGGELIVILVGLIWGLWVGWGIASLGTLLGEIGNFYLFKLLRNRAEKAERSSYQWAQLAHITREGGFLIVLAVRYSALPSHFSTAIFATCGTGIVSFTIAALLSMPRWLSHVYTGVIFEDSADGNESTEDKLIFAGVWGITIIVTIVVMWWIQGKMTKAGPEVRQALRVKRAAALNAVPPTSSKPNEYSDPKDPYDDGNTPSSPSKYNKRRSRGFNLSGSSLGGLGGFGGYATREAKDSGEIGLAGRAAPMGKGGNAMSIDGDNPYQSTRGLVDREGRPRADTVAEEDERRRQQQHYHSQRGREGDLEREGQHREHRERSRSRSHDRRHHHDGRERDPERERERRERRLKREEKERQERDRGYGDPNHLGLGTSPYLHGGNKTQDSFVSVDSLHPIHGDGGRSGGDAGGGMEMQEVDLWERNIGVGEAR